MGGMGFPPGTVFSSPQSSSPAAPRYLRNDLGKSLKSEQIALWEKHYPVGQLCPVSGSGIIADDLKAQVHWYCKATRYAWKGSVDEAIEELSNAGLLMVVRT